MHIYRLHSCIFICHVVVYTSWYYFSVCIFSFHNFSKTEIRVNSSYNNIFTIIVIGYRQCHPNHMVIHQKKREKTKLLFFFSVKFFSNIFDSPLATIKLENSVIEFRNFFASLKSTHFLTGLHQTKTQIEKVKLKRKRETKSIHPLNFK